MERIETKKCALVIREITEEDKEIFPILREGYKFGLFMEHYYANRTEIDLIASSDDKEYLEKMRNEANT